MTEVSREELKKLYDVVIKVPGRRLSYLLRGLKPDYCNYGTYGWNYDVYTISTEDVTIGISTGYSPVGRELLSKRFLKEIDNEAMESQEAAMEKFIQEILRSKKKFLTIE